MAGVEGEAVPDASHKVVRVHFWPITEFAGCLENPKPSAASVTIMNPRNASSETRRCGLVAFAATSPVPNCDSVFMAYFTIMIAQLLFIRPYPILELDQSILEQSVGVARRSPEWVVHKFGFIVFPSE